MRLMLSGFSGWARMGRPRSEQVRTVDTALTVIATLAAAVTWALLR